MWGFRTQFPVPGGIVLLYREGAGGRPIHGGGPNEHSPRSTHAGRRSNHTGRASEHTTHRSKRNPLFLYTTYVRGENGQ